MRLAIENPPAAGEYRVFNQFDLILDLTDASHVAQSQQDFLLLFLGGHLAARDDLVTFDADVDIRVAQADLGNMCLERFGGLRLLPHQ